MAIYCIIFLLLKLKKLWFLQIRNHQSSLTRTESTTFLRECPGKLLTWSWARHYSSLQPLILDLACWYLNASSLHEKFEYKILILIEMNVSGVAYYGTWRVKALVNKSSGGNRITSIYLAQVPYIVLWSVMGGGFLEILATIYMWSFNHVHVQPDLLVLLYYFIQDECPDLKFLRKLSFFQIPACTNHQFLFEYMASWKTFNSYIVERVQITLNIHTANIKCDVYK